MDFRIPICKDPGCTVRESLPNFYRRTGHTAHSTCKCTQMQLLPCRTIPTSLETFSRRKESTIVYYVSLGCAATGDQRKPGTVCLRKVDLTQRGGLGIVACLAGSPGCGGSPTQRATAVESSRVNGGRLSRPCAGTSSTVDLSEQQRTNSNQ